MRLAGSDGLGGREMPRRREFATFPSRTGSEWRILNGNVVVCFTFLKDYSD